MKIRSLTVASLAVLGTALVAQPAWAAAGDFAAGSPAYSPSSVVVGFDRSTPAAQGRSALRAAGVANVGESGPRSAVVRLRPGESPAAAARRIARAPGVRFVKPNYLARASAEFIPSDPGKGAPGDWRQIQWNFAGTFGVNVEPAWDRLRQLGVEGARGVVIAVIDTGVAYESIGPYRRSPDLVGIPIQRPWDFIDGDRHANDRNGHGTHVASTIFENTNNGIGVTGLAYGATLMPLRALDSAGLGDEVTVARAIRFAAAHGADVINLSVEFDVRLNAGQLPTIISAMRYARKRGTLVVAAAGNQAERRVAYPARYNYALAVGATTIRGCLAEYSDVGSGLDLVAPGGGADSSVLDLRPGSSDRANCSFAGQPSPIYQMTFGRSLRSFGLAGGYQGTSMATPHVSATAAMVIASGILGADPLPSAVSGRIEATARDLGYPGYDKRYGYGLVDAGNALTAP
ncbi:MAG: S8 family serine peptidase [Thermoleophilia bacterium]|nr:S8 family serine peptidase [Thermoleophilia bacterium]